MQPPVNWGLPNMKLYLPKSYDPSLKSITSIQNLGGYLPGDMKYCPNRPSPSWSLYEPVTRSSYIGREQSNLTYKPASIVRELQLIGIATPPLKQDKNVSPSGSIVLTLEVQDDEEQPPSLPTRLTMFRRFFAEITDFKKLFLSAVSKFKTLLSRLYTE